MKEGGGSGSGREAFAPPHAIIRHHHAAWACPEALRRKWLDDARRGLGGAGGDDELARSVEWRLDRAMFRERGWVGYTCRHPRPAGMGLGELDRPETIARFDRLGASSGGGGGGGGNNDNDRAEKVGWGGEKRRYRDLSVLVMAEFPARLRELGRLGRGHGEEYLLTAFMTTVTILHE